MEIRNASRPHSPIRKKYLFNLTNPLFANPNPSELFEFLLDYDIDFDTVKLITDIGNLNNFSLN